MARRRIRLSRVQEIFQLIKSLTKIEQDELTLLIEKDASLSKAAKAEFKEIELRSSEGKNTTPYTMKYEEYFANEELLIYLRSKKLRVERFPATGVHLRIDRRVDYWPNTERFRSRSGRKGRGEVELLNELKKASKK
jgi:hypothetical protein